MSNFYNPREQIEKFTKTFDSYYNKERIARIIAGSLREGHASGALTDAIEQTLFGHFSRAELILPYALEWSEISIQHDRVDAGLYEVRFYTKALARWLLLNEAAVDTWAEVVDAIEYRARALFAQEKIKRGDFTTHTMHYYLYACLASKQVERALKFIARTDFDRPKSYKSVKSLRDVAILACLQEGEAFCTPEEARIGAEKVFARLFPTQYFNTGSMMDAIFWLKYFYWDSGRIENPVDVILHAYCVMPNVEQPDAIKGYFMQHRALHMI